MGDAMNNDEARAVLREHLMTWRTRSWTDLRALMGEEQACEVVGPSGVTYQIEINVFWDDEAGGDLPADALPLNGGLHGFPTPTREIGHGFVWAVH
jgi:hypothetical protein